MPEWLMSAVLLYYVFAFGFAFGFVAARAVYRKSEDTHAKR